MLSASEWSAWGRRVGLSDEAQRLIAGIRTAPPSRRVHSVVGNVPCRYPSEKMGQTIQAESHTVELPFVYAAERDRTVLEYWDQPGRIRLVYRSKSGRTVVTGHTPDYFILRTDSAGWVECKPEERLHHLAQAAPHRYHRTTQGQWTCPPGEEYAARYGLTYRLFSSAEINWIEQRNWLFLADYLRADCPTVTADARSLIVAVVADDPGLTLAQVQRRVKTVATADAINILIATTRLYVDLRAYALAEPEYVPVFRDEDTAQAYALLSPPPPLRTAASAPLVEVAPGAPLLWDGRLWTIGNPTATHTPLISAQGAPVELLTSVFDAYVRAGRISGVALHHAESVTAAGRLLLARASAGDLAVANRRYAALKPHLEDKVPLATCAPHIPRRTKFLWAQKWRQAEANAGNGYLGLLPAGRQAVPRRLLTAEHRALLHTMLDDHYTTYRNKKLRRAYGPFLAACAVQGLYELSERTFYTEAQRYLTDYAATRARAGQRAAYSRKPPYQEAEATAPRHGDRPWDIAHIDHTEIDLELLSSRTGRPLGRPWATLLIDAATRRVLALYLTYAPPSYVSCLMLVRLCVQRWGRLPRTLVADGGPEFHSTYFEALLAWYKVTLKTRPPAEPRYGAVCERLFGTANTTFIHTLLGNTQVMKNVRQVTPAVHPKTHARWTLGDLYTWLCTWADDVYDTLDHPALGQSPRDAYTWAESRTGVRAHTRIPYDRDFIIHTLPTTRKGTARVQPGHGVKINTILYWCAAFDDPEVEGTAVAVRYDPFDTGLAYAYLTQDRRWVECHSDYYALLQGRSEREMLLIAAELRKQQRDQTHRAPLTAKRLAEFGTRVDAHEHLLLQRERDAELRTVLTLIQGGQPASGSSEERPPLDSVTHPPLPGPAEMTEPARTPRLLPRLR